MIKFYLHVGGPNPRKVALALEEFGLDYETVPLDIFKGEQHTAAYRAINPNGKVPAIEDDGTRVFDSNAILLYLAYTHGRFLGEEYSIVDMAAWGWVGVHEGVLGTGGIDAFANVKSWFERISARPAAARARKVCTSQGGKPAFDQESARALFPSNFS